MIPMITARRFRAQKGAPAPVPQSPTDIAWQSGGTLANDATAGTTIGVLTATDADSSSWTWSIITQPSGLTLALSGTNPAGTITVQYSSGALSNGTKTVRIQATDGVSTAYQEDITFTVTGVALLTTLTFPNRSGSTQATQWVSKPFGVHLPAGALGSSDYPQFRLASDHTTVCPATLWGKTSHPADSSWRFFGAMIRVPASVAGSGTIDIEIYSGGSAPSASGFSGATLSTADIDISVTGVTNLTGTWLSGVNQGVTDNDRVVTIADGDAGMILRIGQGFRLSGSDHGQMEADHYVQILKNSSAALKGIRYLGRVMQPWADVSSPTPNRRELSGSVRHTGGGTTIRYFSGCNTDETLTSTIGLQHYASFFTCGTNGQWDWVQGGGSDSADCTMGLPQFSKSYFRQSKMLPPMDDTLSPTSNSALNYNPMGRGGEITRNLSQTGERIDIGPVPSWHVREWMAQTANDEQAIRAIGLSGAGWRLNARLSTTNKPVSVRGGGTNYTGLGTSQPTWCLTPGAITGFGSPSTYDSLWSPSATGALETDTSHRPALADRYKLLAFVISGALAGTVPGVGSTMATAPISGSCFADDGGNRNLKIGATTYYNVCTVHGADLSRIAAWLFRDVCQAWAACPDTDPAGSAIKTYLSDVIDSSLSFINAYNAAQSSTFQDNGIYYFRGTDQPSEAPWSLGYMSNAAALGYALTGRSTALTFLNHMGKFWARLEATAAAGRMFGFNLASRDESLVRLEDAAVIMGDLANGQTSWDSSTEVFTVGSGGNGNHNFTPTNGDLIGFDAYFSGNKPFASASDRKAFYVVQASGQTFKLSATLGGSAVDVTTTTNLTRMYARLASFASPRFSYQGGGGSTAADGYVATIRSALRHMEAAGCTTLGSARTAADSAFTTGSISLTSDPKAGYVAAF